MTDTNDQNAPKGTALGRPGKLELKKTVETGQVRQSFSHGRSKMVTVEVRKKRTFAADAGGRVTEIARGAKADGGRGGRAGSTSREAASGLTNREKEARARALQDATRRAEEERAQAPAVVAEEVIEPLPVALGAEEVAVVGEVPLLAEVALPPAEAPAGEAAPPSLEAAEEVAPVTPPVPPVAPPKAAEPAAAGAQPTAKPAEP